MRHCWKESHRRQSGSALIELALCFPVILLLFFGTVDFGRIFYASVELTSAAWAGAAYANADPAHYSDSAGIQAAAQADAQDISPITVSSMKFCQCANGSSVSCAGSCATGAVRTYVQVTASKTFTSWFNFSYNSYSTPQSTPVGNTVTLRVK